MGSSHMVRMELYSKGAMVWDGPGFSMQKSEEIELGTLVHCWWESPTVQLLWKMVRRFLQKLKTEWPAIPLLGVYWKDLKLGSRRDISSATFTAAKTGEEPKCPSTNEEGKWCRDRQWNIGPSLKRRKLCNTRVATIRMNPENILLQRTFCQVWQDSHGLQDSTYVRSLNSQNPRVGRWCQGLGEGKWGVANQQASGFS